MAFFDLDKKIQTMLIAGAIASAAACGGEVGLDGNTDVHPDTYPEMVDPAPDVIDMADLDLPEPVDPAPDVIDPGIDAGVCPDPSGWRVEELTQSTWDYPTATFQATINVPEEFVHLSEPTFSVEKKVISATRVSDTQYNLSYTWSGPLEHDWWDWDRINVSWRVLCTDDGGNHERTLEQQTIVCVEASSIWLGWGTDPDMACMVVDCVPDSMQGDRTGAGSDSSVLARGVLKTKTSSSPTGDGGYLLRVTAKGPQAHDLEYTWSANGGTLVENGEKAQWHPPSEPGVYTIQVTTVTGTTLNVDVFRFAIEE